MIPISVSQNQTGNGVWDRENQRTGRSMSLSEQGHPRFFKIQVSKLDTAARVPFPSIPFVPAAKSTAMPSGLFVPRYVRGIPIITRSLTKAVALCAGRTL